MESTTSAGRQATATVRCFMSIHVTHTCVITGSVYETLTLRWTASASVLTMNWQRQVALCSSVVEPTGQSTLCYSARHSPLPQHRIVNICDMIINLWTAKNRSAGSAPVTILSSAAAASSSHNLILNTIIFVIIRQLFPVTVKVTVTT